MVNIHRTEFYSKTRSGKSYSKHFTDKEEETIYILVNLKNTHQQRQSVHRHRYNTRSSKQ